MPNADVVAESGSIDFDLNQSLPRKFVRRRVPDVVDFLRAALIDGPMLVAEVEARAIDAVHGSSTGTRVP